MSKEFQGIENIDPKTVYLVQVGDLNKKLLDTLERIKDLYLNDILRKHKIPVKVEVLRNNIPFQESWYDPRYDDYWASKIIFHIEHYAGKIIGITDVDLKFSNPFQSFYGTTSLKGKCAIVSIKKFREYVSKATSSGKLDDFLVKIILKFIGHIFRLSNCPYSCLMKGMHDVKTVDLIPFGYCEACSTYLIKGEKLFEVQQINDYIQVILNHTELNVYVKRKTRRGYKRLDKISWWRNQILFVDKDHKVHPWESNLDYPFKKRSPLYDFNRLSRVLTDWAKNGYDQGLKKEFAIPILEEIAIAGEKVAVERIMEYFTQGDPEAILFSLENHVYKILTSSDLEALILTLLKTKAIIPFIDCFERIVSLSLQEEYENEEEEEIEFREIFRDFLYAQLKDIKVLEKKIKSVIIETNFDETELYRIKNFLMDYTPIPYGFLEELRIIKLIKKKEERNHFLDAQIMAEGLAYRFARGIHCRGGVNWIVQAVMNSGANAIEVIINRNIIDYSIPPHTNKVFRCGNITNNHCVHKGIAKYQKGSDIIWIIVKIEINKDLDAINRADYKFQESEELLSKKDTRFLEKLKKLKMCK